MPAKTWWTLALPMAMVAARCAPGDGDGSAAQAVGSIALGAYADAAAWDHEGLAPLDHAGALVVGPGDLDGDGRGEVLVVAPGWSGSCG